MTNEEVRRKIQAAIGEYDELLTLVKKRKLIWFGHVSRSSGLAKTIVIRFLNPPYFSYTVELQWLEHVWDHQN